MFIKLSPSSRSLSLFLPHTHRHTLHHCCLGSFDIPVTVISRLHLRGRLLLKHEQCIQYASANQS